MKNVNIQFPFLDYIDHNILNTCSKIISRNDLHSQIKVEAFGYKGEDVQSLTTFGGLKSTIHTQIFEEIMNWISYFLKT